MVDLIDTPPRVGPPALSAVSTSFRTGARRVRFATAAMLVAEASACVGLGCALRLVDDSSSLGVIAVVAMVALVVARAGTGAVAGAGFVGPALLGALRAAVLVVALFGVDHVRVLTALVAVGALPIVAVLAAELVAPAPLRGEREDLVPTVFGAGCAGGLGVLVAIECAGWFGADAAPVVALVRYMAVAMALLAIAELLARHHRAAGFSGPSVGFGIVGVAVFVALFASGPGPRTDDAVSAVLGASIVVLVGLAVTTILATPRPIVLSEAEAAGGPRFIGVAIAMFAVVGVVVRLVGYSRAWLDDAAIARAANGPFSQMAASTRQAATPPLLEFLGWISRGVMGSTTLVLRLPALTAGMLLIPAAFFLGTELYGRATGLVAAALAAVAPGVVWLSSTADAGAVAALLAAVSLLGMFWAVRRGRARDWALFAVASAALIWSHPFGVVHVAVLQVGAGASVWQTSRRDRSRGKLVGCCVALVVSGAALVGLIVFRHGLGPLSVPAPLEYATPGAPGATQAWFGFLATALAALVGFHPADVSSRLLSLWPLGMLAGFFVMGRRWSSQGVLLVTLAAAPFLVLMVAQLRGTTANPPYALVWVATAAPVIVIGVAHVIEVATGSWPRTRRVLVISLAVLAIALVDQVVRVRPATRFDIARAAETVATAAHPGDVIVYAPDGVGDLVRFYTPPGVDVTGRVSAPARLGRARRVLVIGAFAFDNGASSQPTIGLVRQLASTRRLVSEQGRPELRIWVFG